MVTRRFGVGRWSTVAISGMLVAFACDSGTVDTVEIVPPPAGEAGRWVFLAGALNTRDLGGYATQDGQQVRWNTTYRSGKLSTVMGEGCQAFADLGVRTVIDFRRRFSPLPPFDGDVQCIHDVAVVLVLPISLDSTTIDTPTYVKGVRDHVDSYRGAFELLADPRNLPLLFHCDEGKDRSGIMGALLLTLLGVDRQTVIEEYMLSGLVHPGVALDLIEPLLDEVEDRGGIETYLANIGVTPLTQAAIRENLREARPTGAAENHTREGSR